MKYTNAFLIHSWFTWATCNSIIEKLGLKKESTLMIFSRGFNEKNYNKKGKVVRFEKLENQYISGNFTQASDINMMNLNEWDEIEELIIPHIGYKPFRKLASLPQFKKVSFYQESIQPPEGIMTYREAKLLLRNEKNINTLFTTTKEQVSKKLTNIYYNLDENLTPLHLRSRSIGNLKESIQKYLPNNFESNEYFDYCLIAGKAMNNEDGFELVKRIIRCLKILKAEKIMFKSSPSTSTELEKKVRKLAKTMQIRWISGEESIERLIINRQIGTIISENFTLSALAEIAGNVSIVSIEKTILDDFPSLRGCINERTTLSIYRKNYEEKESMSKHTLKKLKDEK